MYGCSYLLIFGLFSLSLASRDFVPVLIWGTQPVRDPTAAVSGLTKLDSDDFYGYLLNEVKVGKPNIVLFVEENLSVEDFSWKDVNDEGAYPLLTNLTQISEEVSFLPSVRNPYRAVKKLSSHGYSWQLYNSKVEPLLQDDEPVVLVVTLTEPNSLEGRPDLLRSHDMEVVKIYNNILSYTSNLMAIYTGNHSSWIDADVKFTRVKRSEQEEEVLEEMPESEALVLIDKNKTVLMLIRGSVTFQDGNETATLSDTIIEPTVQWTKTGIALDINFRYKNLKPEIDFYFEGTGSESWRLSHAIMSENKDEKLLPSVLIEAPAGYSYSCGSPVTFSFDDKIIQLENIQVQPYVKDGKFGPAVDCVPYFSIAIWSGIFIVLILTLVLAWGIIMIMDINTMDRFDDAKGKTITISASD